MTSLLIEKDHVEMPDPDPKRSRGTQDGIARSIARGNTWGGYRGPKDLPEPAHARLVELSQPGSGLRLHQIADLLNAEGHRTRLGREWTQMSVSRELRRISNE